MPTILRSLVAALLLPATIGTAWAAEGETVWTLASPSARLSIYVRRASSGDLAYRVNAKATRGSTNKSER